MKELEDYKNATLDYYKALNAQYAGMREVEDAQSRLPELGALARAAGDRRVLARQALDSALGLDAPSIP